MPPARSAATGVASAGLSAEELLRRARHVHGTLRLVGEPAAEGGGRDENAQNVFSVASHCLFGFFSTKEACVLRAVCREARDAVAAHPWADAETVILGNLASWRACFPLAVAANVSERDDLKDADFAAHLRGLRTLNMRFCHGITDTAFTHLRGIHTLDMGGCFQRSITDAAFANLRSIHTLNMSRCSQLGITSAAFTNLRGIQRLYMMDCSQRTITDAAFANLRGIHALNMGGCTQATITGVTFEHLSGVCVLGMHRCRASVRATAMRAGLPVDPKEASVQG